MKDKNLKTKKLTEALKNVRCNYGVVYKDVDCDENTSVIIPDDLMLVANQYAKNNHQKIFGKHISGETFINLMTNGCLTLLEQAKYNLIISYMLGKAPTPFPLKPNLLIECLKNETSNLHLTSFFTKDDFDAVKRKFVLPESLKGWCEENDYDIEGDLDESYRKLVEESNEYEYKQKPTKRYRTVKIEENLKRLRNLLIEKNKDENKKFSIINGPAGSGKSSKLIAYINDNPNKICTIVTLSNTIGLMFRKNIKDTTNFNNISITLAGLLLMNPKHNCAKNNDIIIIDEFSQWGLESLDVLIDLLEANKTAKFFFMGDLTQIPTFLSSGSIMHSMMQEFPDNVEYKGRCIEELYRYKNIDIKKEMMKIIKGEEIDPVIVDADEYDLTNVDCVITGSHEHVNAYNDKMINAKFNVDVAGMLLWDQINYCLTNNESTPFSIMSYTTFSVKDNNGAVKIYNSEKFKVKYKNGVLIAESEVIPEKKFTLTKDISYKFKAGYAITVNKAQGLQWDNSIVYIDRKDGNLMNHNALYVALSRSETNIAIITDTSAINVMDKDNINGLLRKNYKMENMFKYID